MRQGEKSLDKLSDVRYNTIYSYILNILFVFLFSHFLSSAQSLRLQKHTGHIVYIMSPLIEMYPFCIVRLYGSVVEE